jgi:hypothetical protein
VHHHGRSDFHLSADRQESALEFSSPKAHISAGLQWAERAKLCHAAMNEMGYDNAVPTNPLTL